MVWFLFLTILAGVHMVLFLESVWKNETFGVSNFFVSVYLDLYSYCFLLGGLHLFLLEDFACLMRKN